MNLRWYRTPRMVVLTSNTTVLEAARALEHNNIGAVIVQDKGKVTGLVTDRDLAVRVVGRGLDPDTTTLGQVMTTPVVTLTPTDSQTDAIRLMQQRNIRRIPLVEDERVVGIVTLDDLLLDEAAPLELLASIVEAQIGEGGPAPSLRTPAARRSAARAQATYGRMLNQLQADAKLDSSDQAEAALEVVLGAIVRRLLPGEAKDLIAQLPSLLQPRLRALPPGPDKSITRQTLEAELSHQLGTDPDQTAHILACVGNVVAQTVTPGQMDDVQRQLPQDLRGIFSLVAETEVGVGR